MLFCDASQGSKFSKPGVGENDIDSPLRLDCLIETVKVGQFGNVALNASHVAADCLHGLIEFLLLTAARGPGAESVGRSRAVAGPAPPGGARGSWSWPTAALIRPATSGESTTTTSPPIVLSSSTTSGRRTMLTVLRPRDFARPITHRPTPELAAFCTTQSPDFKSMNSLSSSDAVGGLIPSIASCC